MIEYVFGMLLCWIGYYSGDKVHRGKALRVPGSQREKLTIKGFTFLAGGMFIGAFVYGFFVFPWWVPILSVVLSPITGYFYVKFEFVLGVAILSVPICGVAGGVFLVKSFGWLF